jgi:fructosamine-3-kinase
MGEVWRVGELVVKSHPSPPAGLFLAEARGLRRLGAAGARVPEVHWAAEAGLVLEYLAPGPADWEGLGRMVARVHRDRSGSYGSAEPLFLGRFALPPGTSEHGVEVLVEHRLLPLLQATRARLGGLASRLERWMATAELPCEGASLVHGDLWSGNVHMAARGPALIDPSTQRAERGYDLAMMELFGGFPEAFWSAYEGVWPIPREVRETLAAYRLVFLLVHVHFFGSGYVSGVRGALDELGA